MPGVVWFHVPNGAKLGAIQGAKFKRYGLRPGVSDILALHNREFFALELKAPKGRATESQLAFLDDVRAAGGHGCVAEGLDEAISILETWGLLKGKAAIARAA